MQDADADAAAMAGDAHELASHPCRPDLVVHDEVLTVETVLDVGALTFDVAEQVPVALGHRARSVQLAGRVADHVVDNIAGEGLERAFDVAVGFLAEVLVDDVVDLLSREAGGGGGHGRPLPTHWIYF